ncbi:AraC family transcriptional regulator [Streptomyces sp. NRRL B-24484]|uniref:AraC family transcriptional regulator n=1 Tax=Streptomyces sp. NRRL B-24484 TaxID=1463833 RepID=UPI0004C0E6FA|nr:AraC family transcriptional regulator [Streptomyces sp. NRRL B-24484]
MEPLARSAALTGYPELCRTLGIDPRALLREVGLDVPDLADQDNWISASAVAQVLEASADAAGREDFGLRMAELRRLSTMGPISLLVREEPDVRSVLHVLIKYEHMYNQAVRLSLDEAGDLATLRISLDLPATQRVRQVMELGMAAYYQILKDLHGGRLRLRQVCFTHRAPADPDTHHRVFAADLRFDAGFNGIVLARRALQAANTEADPILRRYARQYVESLAAETGSSDAAQVRKIIEVLMPAGRGTASQVARSMGIDRRTLHRRLEQSGETFTSLLHAVRVDLAPRFVADGRRPLAEVAPLLGFTSAGAFSRWFRVQFGVSPSQWRSEH